MNDEAEQNNQIALFMEISGADFDTAKQALTVNNFNLEQAINYHLERSNSIGSPEDDVAAASTSTDANLPIDDEDDIRPPILPKREQLILPNEDNFRYRKRRSVVARPVCPLRNFELEGRLQEERLKAAVMGNFTGTIGGVGGDGTEAIDSSTPPLAAQQNSAGKYLNMPNISTNSTSSVLGFSSSTANDLNSIHAKMTAANNLIVHAPAKPSAPSRLSELFRPPVDITFCGSFQAARDYAKEQNKWLIVNVQDMSDFNCQVLNRDIWSSERLRAVIKKYFIFWQVAIDNTDGHRFQVFYGIKVYPYIGIIDPRTGEEKLSYKTGFKLTHDDFMNKLKGYLLENTPHPNTDVENAIVKLDEKLFEIKLTTNSTSSMSSSSSTATTNNHVTSSPCAKRKRVEPSSLSEQEQIELAIAHSLKEVSSAEDGNKSDSFEEPSSDDGFDFDDDTSNQSFVKSQTSQTVSEKSNTFDNKMASGVATASVSTVTTTTNTTTSADDLNDADADADDSDSKEFDAKLAEPCVSTVETYDNYLGDESDEKARIQLRLPTSDRHIFEWPCTTKLKALKLYIPFKYPELTNDPYKVICPFVGGQATNNILEMDDTLTLKEANLYPTAILHLRNDD